MIGLVLCGERPRYALIRLGVCSGSGSVSNGSSQKHHVVNPDSALNPRAFKHDNCSRLHTADL